MPACRARYRQPGTTPICRGQSDIASGNPAMLTLAPITPNSDGSNRLKKITSTSSTSPTGGLRQPASYHRHLSRSPGQSSQGIRQALNPEPDGVRRATRRLRPSPFGIGTRAFAAEASNRQPLRAHRSPDGGNHSGTQPTQSHAGTPAGGGSRKDGFKT